MGRLPNSRLRIRVRGNLGYRSLERLESPFRLLDGLLEVHGIERRVELYRGIGVLRFDKLLSRILHGRFGAARASSLR